MAITNRASLPSLPRLPRASKSKPPRPCECGCAALTRGGRFLPGHDAILLGWTIRVERGVVAEAPAPHTDAVAANVARRAGLAAPETKAQRKARLKAERKARAAKPEPQTTDAEEVGELATA